MSADGSTVCPKCHPDLIGWKNKRGEGVTDFAAEELGYDRSLREYYEFYMRDGDKIVADYGAECRECGFRIGFKHTYEIPGLGA